MSSIDQTQNLSKKRRKTSSLSNTSNLTSITLKITENDILSILDYKILGLPPYDANKKPYTKDELYIDVKKLCALILIHSPYFIPPHTEFYTIVKKVFQFYQKFYSLSSQDREKILNCIYLEYNIAKQKFKFYEPNTTIAKEIYKFNNTLTYKQFSLEFLKLLIKTPIYVIQQSIGLLDFNIVRKNCFKYYFQNCRHQFCDIFDDNKLIKTYESYSLDHLLYQLFPKKIKITKKTIFSMYENVADLPDCSGFE